MADQLRCTEFARASPTLRVLSAAMARYIRRGSTSIDALHRSIASRLHLALVPAFGREGLNRFERCRSVWLSGLINVRTGHHPYRAAPAMVSMIDDEISLHCVRALEVNRAAHVSSSVFETRDLCRGSIATDYPNNTTKRNSVAALISGPRRVSTGVAARNARPAYACCLSLRRSINPIAVSLRTSLPTQRLKSRQNR